MAKLFKGEYVRLDETGYVLGATADAPKSKIEPPPASPALPVPDIHQELEAARQQAQQIMDEANRYMHSMQDQMHLTTQDAFEKARKDGFAYGYAEGHAQGQSQALNGNEQIMARIVSLLQEIDKGKQAIYEKHQQDMLDLALDIARKVIGNQLSKNDKAFLNIFKKAAEGLYGQRTVRLLIAQHEAKVVTTLGDELRSLIAGVERLDVQVLEDAPPGTCILETEDTLIDASAQKQVDKLAQAIEAVR